MKHDKLQPAGTIMMASILLWLVDHGRNFGMSRSYPTRQSEHINFTSDWRIQIMHTSANHNNLEHIDSASDWRRQAVRHTKEFRKTSTTHKQSQSLRERLARHNCTRISMAMTSTWIGAPYNDRQAASHAYNGSSLQEHITPSYLPFLPKTFE
jgi:hypothetical protein